MTAVEFDRVSIVFGDNPQAALPLMDQGKSRAEVQAATGQVLGVHDCSLTDSEGEILVLMAVDVDGKMLGARVLKHTETPGLGDKIEIAKDKWILSFNGKSLGEPPADKWGVKKDGGVFDQFAGATITPRAVVKAVKGGMLFFSEHKAEILGG